MGISALLFLVGLLVVVPVMIITMTMSVFVAMMIVAMIAMTSPVLLVKRLGGLEAVLFASEHDESESDDPEKEMAQRPHGQVCKRAPRLLQLPTSPLA